MGFRLGLPQPHSSKCLIPLWLSALKRPLRFGRGRKAGDAKPRNAAVTGFEVVPGGGDDHVDLARPR